jgi:enoyl-CoA hydratase/carnithine racemase
MVIMGVVTDITDGAMDTVATDSMGDTVTGVVIISTGAKAVAAGADLGLTLRCNEAGLSPAKISRDSS